MEWVCEVEFKSDSIELVQTNDPPLSFSFLLTKGGGISGDVPEMSPQHLPSSSKHSVILGEHSLGHR